MSFVLVAKEVDILLLKVDSGMPELVLAHRCDGY